MFLLVIQVTCDILFLHMQIAMIRLMDVFTCNTSDLWYLVFTYANAMLDPLLYLLMLQMPYGIDILVRIMLSV